MHKKTGKMKLEVGKVYKIKDFSFHPNLPANSIFTVVDEKEFSYWRRIYVVLVGGKLEQINFDLNSLYGNELERFISELENDDA